MLPHLVRLRLSQAHGDNTTVFAPCQEVLHEFFGKLRKSSFVNLLKRLAKMCYMTALSNQKALFSSLRLLTTAL